MKKKIFFAFPLDDVLQNKLLAWENNFRKKMTMPVRWIEPGNLHITLLPPWSVTDEQIDFIKGLLLPVILKVVSFDAELSRIQFGPEARMPHLIWAEGRTPPAAEALKKELEQILKHADVGFHPQQRPLRFHATLARFRPEDFASFPLQSLDEHIRGFGTVSSVDIMQSIIGMEGSEYKMLHRFFLKGK